MPVSAPEPSGTSTASPPQGRPPLIYFIVGEPSGDQIGGHLMRALTRQTGGAIEFAGIGGPAMAEAGLRSLFSIDLFAVMGLDFLPGLREILKRMTQLENNIVSRQPDCVVMIDAQTLSSRMGKRLKKQGVPLVQYAAPTVWAWRAGRAAKVARYLDHLLTIFPFEAPYFEPRGLATTFVGHPAAEPDPPSSAAIDAFRESHVGEAGRGDGGTPVLCLLPGSRRKELRRQLPLYREVLRQINAQGVTPVCLMPLVSTVRGLAEEMTADWPAPLIRLPAESTKYLAFGAADVALAASGTVTVELAIAGTPTVVSYKLPWHESRIGRMVLKTPYVSAVNIIAGAEIMPECVLDRCKPSLIVDELLPLLTNPALRAEQAARIRTVGDRLAVQGRKPSDIAAEAILTLVTERGVRGPKDVEPRGQSERP